MPLYLTDTLLWSQLWPVLVTPLILAAMVASVSKVEKTNYWERLAPLAAVSTLGIVIGDLTGQSRTAVVGEVVPAFLTLIGGLLIYLVGLHGAHKQQLVAASVLTMSMTMFLGVNWGTHIRQEFEDRRASPAYRLDLEKQEISLRKALNLPASQSNAPTSVQK